MSARKYIHTPESDAMIRAAYQNGKMFRVKAVSVTARRLGWPGWAVKKRAMMLGLSRTKELPWSAEEFSILEKFAHQHPKIIQGKLKRAGFHRTEAAIVLKRKRTNLLSNLDGYSATSLANLFGLDPHCITRWIKAGWLRAERRITERTEKQGGDTWFIRHRAAQAFAIAHPDEYDLAKVEKLWFLDLITEGRIGVQIHCDSAMECPF